MKKCIETTAGNLFVQVKVGKNLVFFYFDPRTGKHKNKQQDFHPKKAYDHAVKKWGKPEIDLPEEHHAAVQAIADKYQPPTRKGISSKKPSKQFA